MIKEYRKPSECAWYWLQTCFNHIDSDLIKADPEWYDKWNFYSDEKEDEDYDVLDEDLNMYYVNPPMWNTWFEPRDNLDYMWMEKHQREIAELGFTIIHNEDGFWGLGIDGAGYSFNDAHFTPLYKLRGFKWHDEEE